MEKFFWDACRDKIDEIKTCYVKLNIFSLAVRERNACRMLEYANAALVTHQFGELFSRLKDRVSFWNGYSNILGTSNFIFSAVHIHLGLTFMPRPRRPWEQAVCNKQWDRNQSMGYSGIAAEYSGSVEYFKVGF